MHLRFYLVLVAFLGLITGCRNTSRSNEQVITQRFIHKYGYDVSKEEWENERYPGQVITTLRNGVTMTASYEEGILHGLTTYTYPYSHTIQSQYLYERGNLIKKTSFDIRGVPTQEELFLSPVYVKVTKWYAKGTPRSVEEYENGALVEGEYFSLSNETEAKVQNGFGERIERDEYGKLLCKENYENSAKILVTTYYPNGTPHMQIPYLNGKIHGERKVFAQTGEPLQIENFHNGILDGLSTYFQNGTKYLEISFVDGKRHGMERHFIDGETLVEETKWEHDFKHGPSIVYSDGFSRTQWFFNGYKVSKSKYDALTEQEKTMAAMTERAHKKERL
ncbi:MAG: toxin-antitoxin system YwqK family antitoxin [Simkaniaceae bacterium]